MIKSLKAIFAGFTVPVTFTITSIQSSSEKKKSKRSAYKITDRQKWTDADYYMLLKNSFLG
jgi:hypothetical protein